MHVYISGRVQGVFFRAHTIDTARSLDLAGWVRNLPDGRVEAIFEGEDANMEAMLAWCKKGPPFAIVNQVEEQEEPVTGKFSDFGIHY